MNGKAGNKRPRPSYEDGKLRDPGIEKMQGNSLGRSHFLALIKRAVKGKAPEGASRSQ